MTRRIVIAGSGFAGMWSALSAARLLDVQSVGPEVIEIVLVAPEPVVVIRPRLYQAPDSQMAVPIDELLSVTGVRYLRGHVTQIFSDDNAIQIRDAQGEVSRLGFDRLVLATGSKLVRPHIPGFEAHVFSVDQLEDATALQAHLSSLKTRTETRARNTVLIVGGGFTGIELATEMPARLKSVLGDDATIHVVLLERANVIGPELGAGPRPLIENALDELGVERRLGATIVSFDAGGAVLETGERIEAETIVWSGGMRASPLTEQIPADCDEHGRLRVDRDLRVPGLPHIYATGDTARAGTDEAGHVSLMSCQHAMVLGRSAGHNAAADLLGLATIPYSQPRYVTCLDLGAWGAVVTEGWDRQVKTSGADAKALKTFINMQLISPPRADRVEAFAAADPLRHLAG
jgi:NADH dehydrogenase